jgi:hypothetical protein
MNILIVQVEQETAQTLYEILGQIDNTTVAISYANTARQLFAKSGACRPLIPEHAVH